jgi:hypothetical protein
MLFYIYFLGLKLNACDGSLTNPHDYLQLEFLDDEVNLRFFHTLEEDELHLTALRGIYDDLVGRWNYLELHAQEHLLDLVEVSIYIK